MDRKEVLKTIKSLLTFSSDSEELQKFAEKKTKDGKIIRVEGEEFGKGMKVFLIDEDGEKEVSNETFETDDNKIVVKDGEIEEIIENSTEKENMEEDNDRVMVVKEKVEDFIRKYEETNDEDEKKLIIDSFAQEVMESDMKKDEEEDEMFNSEENEENSEENSNSENSENSNEEENEDSTESEEEERDEENNEDVEESDKETLEEFSSQFNELLEITKSSIEKVNELEEKLEKFGKEIPSSRDNEDTKSQFETFKSERKNTIDSKLEKLRNLRKK